MKEKLSLNEKIDLMKRITFLENVVATLCKHLETFSAAYKVDCEALDTRLDQLMNINKEQ
ncbi:MAG: hypothetical protein A3E87_01675 [Gammaproteobacteria bacterium RIFCSPHIGHO2_12_FULL_35_23]|nr:MAG: hypothetical protein A3E87_01675 [Gammaproteobacteria bacterium RIFCSPHIGHO2_12_FULL_35_23]